MNHHKSSFIYHLRLVRSILTPTLEMESLTVASHDQAVRESPIINLHLCFNNSVKFIKSIYHYFKSRCFAVKDSTKPAMISCTNIYRKIKFNQISHNLC